MRALAFILFLLLICILARMLKRTTQYTHVWGVSEHVTNFSRHTVAGAQGVQLVS